MDDQITAQPWFIRVRGKIPDTRPDSEERESYHGPDGSAASPQTHRRLPSVHRLNQQNPNPETRTRMLKMMTY